MFSIESPHRGDSNEYTQYTILPGRVAQSEGHLTRKSEVLGSIPRPHTFVSPSTGSRRAVVSYWRKYVHEVLVNRLGGLSLPRKSVVRLTDRPDMTLDVYRGRKTTTQQQYAIFNINTKNDPKLSQVCSYEIFSKGLKNEFETAVLNESSVFEPLKF